MYLSRFECATWNPNFEWSLLRCSHDSWFFFQFTFLSSQKNSDAFEVPRLNDRKPWSSSLPSPNFKSLWSLFLSFDSFFSSLVLGKVSLLGTEGLLLVAPSFSSVKGLALRLLPLFFPIFMKVSTHRFDEKSGCRNLRCARRTFVKARF